MQLIGAKNIKYLIRRIYRLTKEMKCNGMQCKKNLSK